MLLGNIIGALVSAVSCVAAVEQELDTAYDVGLRDTVGIWLNTVGKNSYNSSSSSSSSSSSGDSSSTKHALAVVNSSSSSSNCSNSRSSGTSGVAIDFLMHRCYFYS